MPTKGRTKGQSWLEGCNLPGRLWLPPAGDLPHLLSAGPVVFAAVRVTEHCWAGLVGEGCGFRKLWRSERRCPCGHASESLRPWAVVECCGAASAGAPVGVHPNCASLGLLPGVGAGPEPGVLRECFDWLVLATPVSAAVPANGALRLFLG